MFPRHPISGRAHLMIAAVTLTVMSSVSIAADKNGVSPNTVSLPSGPGSIEGMGEAFQPMLNTGTARYAVSIDLPPGVAGHSPTLTLQYDSGLGDGPASLGWAYGPGSISRQIDKGLPRYVDTTNGVDDDHDGSVDEPDEIDRFVGPDGEELVPFAEGLHRARIEGNFARYRRVGDSWHVDLKSGTRLLFGGRPETRITDATGERVYRWLLQTSTDPNDNVIQYSYASIPGSDNQKYLKEIRYGPGSPPWGAFYFVSFSYEPKPDWRKDYRSGFLVRTAHRLAQIDIGIQGVQPDQCAPGDWNDDGTSDALISRYALTYDDTTSHIKHLTQVTRFGSDGVNYLPPVSFRYATYQPGKLFSAADAIITAVNAPPTVMDSPLVDLIDLNRDGLPDILKTDLYGGSHTAYRNLGTAERAGAKATFWGGPQSLSSADGLAPALHLAEDQVNLADMDGDGLADLVHTTLAQEVFFYRNRGGFAWDAREPMSIRETAPPAPAAFAFVKITDLDFNKRMDVVKSTDSGLSTWYNYAEGAYSREVRSAGCRVHGRVMRFTDSGFDFADINGDRLNDAVRITANQVVYCANMGHGNFAAAVEIPIPDAVLSDGSNGQIQRARLSDINGDGLADLVVERAEANTLWFWLNQGIDAFSGQHTVSDMPTLFGPNTAVRWADLNGNGTTDLVYADSSAADRLRMLDLGEVIGGSAHPNLLTGIDNGLGRITTIAYRSSTEHYLAAAEEGNPWVTTVPFPVTLVSRVETTPSLNLDTTPGLDVYAKDYLYRDGFYEDRERQFRGFAQVRVTEHGDDTAPTRVTRHEFFTGGPDGVDNDGDGDIDEVSPENHREEDALKGMVRVLEVRSEAGSIFNRDENAWAVRNLLTNPSGIEVRFAYKTRTDALIYEGTDAPETLRTRYSYDDFGNVTAQQSQGALSIEGDELFTSTEYINDTDNWLLGFPRRQLVTDAAGNQAAETLSYYDGPDYVGLPLGQVKKGNLTRQQGWVAGSDYIDQVRSAYDSYGNIVAILDPNGHRRTIAYDPGLHLYPVREEIEIGGGSPDLSVIAAYNLGLGVVTSSLDFNGHQTLYSHDPFGRLTAIILPGDTPELPTQTFVYTAADPANGLLYQYDTDGKLDLITESPVSVSSVATRAREDSGESGTFDAVQYVDGMGRKLALVTEAESGYTVEGAARFNALGGPRYSFLPYAAASPQYARPNVASPAVETRYDAAGRPVLQINPPDADGLVTSVSTELLPLHKTVIDENGNRKHYVSDGREQLTEVREENQGETYVTRYTYDTLGNLTRIVDAQDNLKTLAYDGLGRRTDLNDPDRGHMGYFYDTAGNLFRTVDNKGQEILYTYDGANRMLTEDYLDQHGITPDIAYHYDTPSEEYPMFENTMGKLAWVQDLSGGAFFGYDPNGNIVWSVKRITDRGRSKDYLSKTEFDALGRITSLAYPDGDRVQYRYNNRSLLESIPGIVDSIDYHPSGQIDAIKYTNDIQTHYSYDPRQRLRRLHTENAGQSDPIQDLSYSLDGVGNIADIADGRPLPAGHPKSASQSFLYDDLHRLIRSEGSGYGSIAFQYDQIGNMVFKHSPVAPDPTHIDDPLINLGVMHYGGGAGSANRSGRLPGDPPGPHAVTGSDSGLIYDYDNNGNMIDHAEGDRYSWDFKDRLVQIQSAGANARYSYDYSGQRVTKGVGIGNAEQITHYVNDSYEIREGKSVKYVFAGSRRVARIEGRVPDPVELAQQVLAFYPGWNLFSLDVAPEEPSVSTLLDPVAGDFTQVWSFDAQSQSYKGYKPAEGLNDLSEIQAGQGYLIHMLSPAILNVSGEMTSETIPLLDGWNLIAPPSHVLLPVEEAFASISDILQSVWAHDATNEGWLLFDPLEPGFLNDLRYVEPGSAYWVKTEANGELAYADSEARLFFYHPDHLGSTNVITDANGAVVESTEFYPYGRPRFEEKSGFGSDYRYTGKELDLESGLMYYEARYYEPVVGRFVSVDPLGVEVDARKTTKLLGNPQQTNIYTYALSNPLKWIDPTGLDVVVSLYRGAVVFGHIGIEVILPNKRGSYVPDTRGFYADPSLKDLNAGLLFLPVKGEMKQDDMGKLFATIRIKTTIDQDNLMLAELEEREENPDYYALLNLNCASTVCDVLSAAEIETIKTILPKKLFEYLKQKYGSQQQSNTSIEKMDDQENKEQSEEQDEE